MPARIAVEHRSQYDLYAERGDVTATLAGRLRRSAARAHERPAVGDWVALEPPTADGPGTIHALLPRASAFTRKVAGRERVEQIVAANIDIIFLVTSLNAELNLRRLERYLAMAWESGARPIIVLSKADRCDDPAPRVAEVEVVAAGAPVLVTSTKTGQGIEGLRAALAGHRTGALLGSSGVGKSSLINALVGDERQATAEVRESDAKGRHTTARRELVRLPGGGLLIDTPGMRELALSEAGHGLLTAFEDIEALAAACTFGDCQHGPEPGCAVRAAVAEGRLTAQRLESYHKLMRELAHRVTWESTRAAVTAKQKVKVADRALQKRLREKKR